MKVFSSCSPGLNCLPAHHPFSHNPQRETSILIALNEEGMQILIEAQQVEAHLARRPEVLHTLPP